VGKVKAHELNSQRQPVASLFWQHVRAGAVLVAWNAAPLSFAAGLL